MLLILGSDACSGRSLRRLQHSDPPGLMSAAPDGSPISPSLPPHSAPAPTPTDALAPPETVQEAPETPSAPAQEAEPKAVLERTPRPQLPRASSSPTRVAASVPTPTLLATVHDLRTLLRTFLVFIPASLRRLRFLLPSPLLRLSRSILQRAAMTLHKRGALASNLFFDLLVVLWSTMIHLFFREIRSRGAWKIPRDGEGAVIFVVGPHHNQASPRPPCRLR